MVTEKFKVSSTQGQEHKHQLIKVSGAGWGGFILTNNENTTVKGWFCYTSELPSCYFCCKCTHSSCFWCCCYINSILQEAKVDKKWWEYIFFTNELPSPNWNISFSNIFFCSELPFLFQIYFLPQKSSITVAQLLVSYPSSKNPKIDISIKSSVLNNELVFSRYFITCSQVSHSLKWRNKKDAWFCNRHHKATEFSLLLGIRYTSEKAWGKIKELYSSFIQKDWKQSTNAISQFFLKRRVKTG